MTTDLVKVEQLPPMPANWDYEQSVTKVAPLIYKWKNLTLEIATELYIAREKLATKGGYLLHSEVRGTNVPSTPTWEEYCEAIGLEKRTANRWLASIFGPQRLPSPLLPKLESQVLYADPPWAFDNSGLPQSAAQQYPTLKPELIENYTDENGRQIRQLARQKESVLFLWVPEAIVPDGLKILQGWGFVYKAQMIWQKDRAPGMGWWVNSKHEQLFIGARGVELHPAIKGESTADRVEKSYTGELMAKGTANEDIILDWLKNTARHVIDFRDFRLTQRIDVDFGIESIDGDVVLAEIKSDRHLSRNGNLLFECFRINHYVAEHWFYLGWGWRSPAQKLITRNPNTNFTVVTNFPDLRSKIASTIAEEGKHFRARLDIVETDQQKTTFNFLVPLIWLTGIFKEYDVEDHTIGKQGNLWRNNK